MKSSSVTIRLIMKKAIIAQKKIFLKYGIILIVIFLIALINIWNIEREKVNSGNDFKDEDLSGYIADPGNSSKEQDLYGIEDKLISISELEPLKNYSGGGEDTVSLTEGFYIHSVCLKTKEAEEGMVYEAWLRKNNPDAEYFNLGQLNKKDDGYELIHVSELDRSDYPEIVITQNKLSDLGTYKPENIIFSGKFENQ